MNEEMRKEFEEWCKQQWFVNLETKNDVYISSKTNILWLAWKASREAMMPIKFPCELEIDLIGDQVANSHSNSYSEGYNDALRDLELKITELGYKVE